MIRTTIFDIPIYSMSEECFNKKWDEAVASKIQNYEQASFIRSVFGNTIILLDMLKFPFHMIRFGLMCILSI